ncbi:MAG: threonine--tRNA ligase [Planctomycetes bacterium UTPLA1]|nr:MAG: threonine--tRNA ligase [Planctomycetes bacterium UTPLA1]
MTRITLPDNSVKELSDRSTGADVAAAIGPGLAKAALGVIADFGHGPVTLDLATPLSGDCRLKILTDKSEESLTILRHSTAHVMAEAICRLWPETKLVYGPPVEEGFYYDIDLAHRLKPEDFLKIEEEMGKIVAEDRPFTRYEMSRDEGLTKVRKEGNPYKVENAERAKGDVLSFYVTGPEPGAYWEDLCMGTHVPRTGRIAAFKVLSVSGAFLHGDASKQQLQRVYGTAFFSKKQLTEHLTRLEEAKKRDHRKIGQELGLFSVDPLVGSGLILWKPKGATIRLLLENHLRDKLREQGYQPVFTPHIGRLELYRTSGHFPYYRDAQFPPLYESDAARLLNELWVVIAEAVPAEGWPAEADRLLSELKLADKNIWTQISGADEGVPPNKRLQRSPEGRAANLQIIREHLATSDGFLLKPMNCPHHIRIFASEPRSYRDLPVRLAEFGTVYRYEKSGEVSGLTRVRGFTQDDAHLFCTPEQLQDELVSCLSLTRYVLEMLDLKDYRVRIGLHDPNDAKFIKNPQAWAEAEAAVRAAAARSGMTATEEIGEAAFYGPKIDFVVKDCIGREWQLGTVQVDYQLPNRFDLSYIGADNQPHRPVMIHRAPFGSMERFFGLLIEHFAGAFPLWLAPEQIRVLTISDKFAAYGRKVLDALLAEGFRATLDQSGERVQAKIKIAQDDKVPYMLIVGGKDEASGSVSVRDRVKGDVGAVKLEEFIEKVKAEAHRRGDATAT